MAKSQVPIQDRTSLSLDEVSQLLGVNKITLYRYIHAGELPSYRIGRRRLIRRDALDDFQRHLESVHTRALQGHIK